MQAHRSFLLYVGEGLPPCSVAMLPAGQSVLHWLGMHGEGRGQGEGYAWVRALVQLQQVFVVPLGGRLLQPLGSRELEPGLGAQLVGNAGVDLHVGIG